MLKLGISFVRVFCGQNIRVRVRGSLFVPGRELKLIPTLHLEYGVQGSKVQDLGL